MRVRTLCCAVVSAVASVALLAAPASAGTGSSTWCGDGVGYREIPILTSPITVGLELYQPPGSTYNTLIVCFSTTAVGQPGFLTGGAIRVEIDRSTNLASPGASVTLVCAPDIATGVFPTCSIGDSVSAATGDVAVSTPSSGICVVSLGAGCLAYVPGVKLVTGASPAPTLALTLLGVPLAVDVPAQCVAVVVTCP